MAMNPITLAAIRGVEVRIENSSSTFPMIKHLSLSCVNIILLKIVN